jgi:Co/Zn/Cd efflux system component
MSVHCCGPAPAAALDTKYRRVLWAALAINAAMFAIEVAMGLAAGSMSLQADALDFLGDAANYAIGLAVLGLSLRRRAQAALVKGVSMAVFGLWVAGNTAWSAIVLETPDASIMGGVGLLALAANIAVAAMLYRHRNGDSNRRSVWLCSRNDAIGNVAVVLAASGVFATGTAWPDLLVAAIMAALALAASVSVIRQASGELRHAAHSHRHESHAVCETDALRTISRS